MCDECGGSSTRLSPSLAKLTGRSVAWIPCHACLGTGVVAFAIWPVRIPAGAAEIGPGVRTSAGKQKRKHP